MRTARYRWLPGHDNLDGRFQCSPMMIDSEDSLESLRAVLKWTPKLRALGS